MNDDLKLLQRLRLYSQKCAGWHEGDADGASRSVLQAWSVMRVHCPEDELLYHIFVLVFLNKKICVG